MKTTVNVPEGNGNIENLPATSSSPKAAEESPGVTNGIGIPDAAGDINISDSNAGKDSSKK